MLVVSLDQYIVVVALPEIGRDLGFSDQTLQATVTAYAILEAAGRSHDGGGAWEPVTAATIAYGPHLDDPLRGR